MAELTVCAFCPVRKKTALWKAVETSKKTNRFVVDHTTPNLFHRLPTFSNNSPFNLLTSTVFCKALYLTAKSLPAQQQWQYLPVALLPVGSSGASSLSRDWLASERRISDRYGSLPVLDNSDKQSTLIRIKVRPLSRSVQSPLAETIEAPPRGHMRHYSIF